MKFMSPGCMMVTLRSETLLHINTPQWGVMDQRTKWSGKLFVDVNATRSTANEPVTLENGNIFKRPGKYGHPERKQKQKQSIPKIHSSPQKPHFKWMTSGQIRTYKLTYENVRKYGRKHRRISPTRPRLHRQKLAHPRETLTGSFWKMGCKQKNQRSHLMALFRDEFSLLVRKRYLPLSSSPLLLLSSSSCSLSSASRSEEVNRIRYSLAGEVERERWLDF